MRVFLDTNVLLDITSRRAPFFELSKKLLFAKMFGDIEIWVSAKSYTDMFYLMRKQGCDSEATQAVFERGIAKYYDVCSVDSNAIKAACGLRWPDFEDCLISVCAANVGADYIITRDVKGFGRSSTKAVSPEEFLEILDEQFGYIYEEVRF